MITTSWRTLAPTWDFFLTVNLSHRGSVSILLSGNQCPFKQVCTLLLSRIHADWLLSHPVKLTVFPDRRRQDSLLNPKNRVFIVKYFGEDYHYNRVFSTYMQRLRDYKVIDVGATLKEGYMSDSPRYYLFILGLLAMQLGCSLKSEHRRWMKANYQACLPLYERFEQAKMAVFEYEDGKPLKLDSKTVQEKMVALANLPGEQSKYCQ